MIQTHMFWFGIDGVTVKSYSPEGNLTRNQWITPNEFAVFCHQIQYTNNMDQIKKASTSKCELE